MVFFFVKAVESVTAESLVGEIVRLTFHDPVSTFTVAKLKVSSQEATIVGHMPFIQVGQLIRCQGAWQINPRHGRQFSVEKFSYELPSNIEAIEHMLGSKFIPGIGQKTAKRIVEKFGATTFAVLEHTPERLYEIEGLGKKRADKIIEKWKSRTQLQELLVLLCSWGISHTAAARIFQRWGSEALSIIKSNPYRLAKEISGFGFLMADKIAEKLGIPKESSVRIDAALSHFLWEFSNDGHTCIPQEVFIPHAAERLSIPIATTESRLVELIKQKEILNNTIKNTTCVTLPQFFTQEHALAKNILRLSSCVTSLRPVDPLKALQWSEGILNMQFAEQQKQAIICALQNKVCIITGGPGTGKSTITRAIVSILSVLTKKIYLVAPTGRAAKRLHEITNRYAQTIHRLLKFNPATATFTYHGENYLPCDVVIIDEASMIDTSLAQAIFSAIPDHAHAIIVGDVDQLPSIGPGNVLRDLIESKKIATVRLDRIFRQARHSKIVENSHRINLGLMPHLHTHPNSDFVFIKSDDPEIIRKEVIELVTKKLPDQFHLRWEQDIQIIAPMRKGTCGIDQLNADIQAYHCQLHAKRRRGRFVQGDKVIQLKNNYQKEVFNGDIGFVLSVEERSLIVGFDDQEVVYEDDETEELSLAWAVSVHKYQGSECPCVVIPIHTQHFKLLKRNLLYTAVTRGKKLVVLVGSPKAVAICVHQQQKELRWTNLPSFMTELHLSCESPEINI
jgi:exodeoxyribonuclease V alpha subunit